MFHDNGSFLSNLIKLLFTKHNALQIASFFLFLFVLRFSLLRFYVF